ncbi:hypothetical protein KC332_g13115 [Hortaea werneckii]|nr:hypothetical protein KC358_g13066 [Hortaea werneckii]KAI6809847.1 hypothetical protein KC350_g12745 [Hortaea werneckii]KAI6910653.1 hypothetical protein KC348_g13150 [Hortaea werneckii]KAI6927129.1 hypothetical protein KC341_g12333 [Hortaea werneckii]KAI6960178.1 hypothetical protein KC321_g12996 [Hortaea werneckii]
MQQSSNSRSTNPGTGRRSVAFPSASPPHHRHPSLGELHQELENEQEAQVNRLLHLIRLQQDELAVFQRQQSDTPSTSQISPGPGSSVTNPDFTTATPPLPLQIQAHPFSPSTSSCLPHQLSRHSSSTQRSSPPALRPISGTESPSLRGTTMTRDDNAFYQAETQTLRRENRMLKERVRELERQILELNTANAVDSEAG